MEQRAHFSKKLEDLKVKVLRMAALSESAVHKAAKAFLENDSDLAEEVILGDKRPSTSLRTTWTTSAWSSWPWTSPWPWTCGPLWGLSASP